MCSTMQCVKPKTDCGSWSTLFEDANVSCSKSVLFMKKLLALGVSNILYWRGLLPHSAFGERLVGDRCLKILRREESCRGAIKVIDWIKVSFEPISKGWLRNFHLVIRDQHNKDIIEIYTFKFQYTDDDVQTEIFRNSKKIHLTEGKTVHMLTSIADLVKPLGPVVLPCMVSIDMDFYQSTPALEIPRSTTLPGFKPVVSLEHEFDEKRIAVRLGDVETAYHGCRLQVKTKASRLSIGGSQEQHHNAPTDEMTAMDECQEEARNLEGNKLTAIIKCPCDCVHEDLETLVCNSCETLHHLVCYGFLPDGTASDVMELIRSHFVCFSCSPYLAEKYEANVFKNLCLTRQALVLVDDSFTNCNHPVIVNNPEVQRELLDRKILKRDKRTGELKAIRSKLSASHTLYFSSKTTVTSWSDQLFSKSKRMRMSYTDNEA